MTQQLRNAVNEIKKLSRKGPVFVVMVGIPGCGKTFFAETLVEHVDCVIASTDNFDVRMKRYKMGFLPCSTGM